MHDSEAHHTRIGFMGLLIGNKRVSVYFRAYDNLKNEIIV